MEGSHWSRLELRGITVDQLHKSGSITGPGFTAREDGKDSQGVCPGRRGNLLTLSVTLGISENINTGKCGNGFTYAFTTIVQAIITAYLDYGQVILRL